MTLDRCPIRWSPLVLVNMHCRQIAGKVCAFLLLAVMLATHGSEAIATCQENQGSDTSSLLPVPEKAKWRFGQINVSDAPNGYYRLACSPNGKFIAARNRLNVVEVRDAKTRKLVCELASQKLHIKWMEFSSDSMHLMTVSTADEPVLIWNVQSGQVIEKIDCRPQFATFSQSGNRIVILESDRVLEYSWPECLFRQHSDFQIKSENHPVVSRDGRFLIVSEKVNNRRLNLTKLVDLESDSSLVLPGPSKPPKRVVFSDDNMWVAATYSFESRIRLWNLANPSDLNFTLAKHDQTVESIAFSADSRFLATTGKDKKVFLWDLVTREPVAKLEGHSEYVISAAFSPVNWELVTGASGLSDSTAIVWDLNKLLFPKPVKKVSSKGFPSAWKRLGSSLPDVALASVNNLQFSADEVIEELKSQLGNPLVKSEDEVLKLIEQLDAGTFKEREAATEKLKAVRGQSERLLLEVLNDSPSTEVRFRIGQVLQYSASRPKINVAELRRLHRSILLLELISQQPKHKEGSIEVLQVMSQTHPHLDVSRDAAAALSRISFRDKLATGSDSDF